MGIILTPVFVFYRSRAAMIVVFLYILTLIVHVGFITAHAAVTNVYIFALNAVMAARCLVVGIASVRARRNAVTGGRGFGPGAFGRRGRSGAEGVARR